MRRFLVHKKTGGDSDPGPPPPKKVALPASPSAKSNAESRAKYEDKRHRGFQPVWRQEFCWLIYDPKEQAKPQQESATDATGTPAPSVAGITVTGTAAGGDNNAEGESETKSAKMFCRPCCASYGKEALARLPDKGKFRKYSKGPFVVGCSNMKRTTLSAHQDSEGHVTAVEHHKNLTAAPGSSTAEKALKRMNHAVFDKLGKLFRNAHAIAKYNRPFSDYVWMAKLDEKKGLFLGETYRNVKACKHFVHSIADVERRKVAAAVKEAKFVTIISDGSTDVSVCENEIVYLQYCHRGIPKMHFISMKAVEKADANGIFTALSTSLSDISVSPAKVVGFTADGASVNTGEFNGVIAKMRNEWSPCIVMVRCLVHRLELAMKDVFKGDSQHDKVVTLLSGLYAFYHKSPLQRAGLKASFTALDIPPVMPTRIGGTRWLSHTLLALEKLWQAYRPIVQHLEQVSHDDARMAASAKAKGLLKLLKGNSIISYGHFLNDVLVCLSKVSRILQQSKSSIYTCHEQLATTRTTLEKLRDRPGYHLRTLQGEEDLQFQDQVLTAGPFTYPVGTVDKLLRSLETRYADISADVLGATKIADLRSWPVEYQAAFGDDCINTLCDHWQPALEANGVDCAEVESEWDSLKSALYNNDNIHQISWRDINVKYANNWPNVLAVFDLVLSLPASSAECERGFSAMKLIKSDTRNRLKADMLTDLLYVKLLSESVDKFDPEEAIVAWNASSTRARRPYHVAAVGAQSHAHESSTDSDTDTDDLSE